MFNDAVVLNNEFLPGADHQAILIGNDENGWVLFSKDGYGRGTTVATYDTLAEALSSVEIRGKYDSAWRNETTEAQDQAMAVEGVLQSFKGYSLPNNNCGDLVKACLDAGNVDGGNYPDTLNPRSTRSYMDENWEDISDQLQN